MTGATNTQIILILLRFFQTFEKIERWFIMNKQTYYRLDSILKINADYNLIYGERANGKSYAIKEKMLLDFKTSGGKFVYIRRYDRDVTTNLATSYFDDMPIEKIFNGVYNNIHVHGGNVYLCNIDESGKREHITHCGYVRALNNAQRYSSTTYPDVINVVLEEFITLDNTYLPNELFLFNHILSTIARRRNITVFLVANTISRISPYWREYGVEDIIKKQKQGTIYTVERDTEGGKQLIAVEYCARSGGVSKMFDLKNSEMTNAGKWHTEKYPRIYPVNISECSNPYSFVVEYTSFKFYVQYLITPQGEYFLFVTPKTSDVKENTRVISDKYSINPLYTRGLIPLNAKERLIFEMLYNGKTYFCDDQTGTEFNTAIKKLKTLT